MDRITPKAHPAATLSAVLVASLVLAVSCSQPLELRDLVEQRVIVATTPPVPDAQNPTGSVSIASGSAYTQDVAVMLAITASDSSGSVAQMEIRNDSAFTGNWQTYATSLPWTLAGPDGANSIYIRFKDDSGNNSITYSDTIILDRVNPSVSSRPIVAGTTNAVRSATVLSYTFSEAMDPATLNSATVKLDTSAGSNIVNVTIGKPDATHVTLTLSSLGFYFGNNYTLRLLAGIKDLSGRALPAESTNFTIENDVFENTGTVNFGKGNEYPNAPFWLWSSDPASHATSGQLSSQEYDGYLARTQSIGGLSDQDRYQLYIDCAQSNSITIHAFTTSSTGVPTGVLAAGQGIKFVLYNAASSPVLISSNSYSLLKNDQLDTWTIPSGTLSGNYTLVIFGDDSGRYYDFSWSEDYNGM